MQNTKCKIVIIFLFWLSLQLMSSPAFAHKVNVFAYVEGDMVYTESYFPDGRKVGGGVVEVFDADGKKLLEGKTDKNGQFNFKVSRKEDLRIILNASLGHRGVYTLSADEISDIRKEVKPNRVFLRDIVAGIGYILGITGIAMYFLSRKRINASA